MANYDEQTRAKMQASFAAINPVEASGGIRTGLYGQSAKSAPAPTAAPKGPGFWSGLASSATNAVKATPGLLGKIATAVFVEPYTKTAQSISTALTGNQRLDAANRASDVNNDLVMSYIKSYRAGKITRDQLNQRMVEIGQDNKAISDEVQQLQHDTNAGASRDVAINMYASVLTPLTMFSGLTTTAAGAAPLGARLLASGDAALDASKASGAARAASIMLQARGVGRVSMSVDELASKIPSLGKIMQRTPEATTFKKQAFDKLVKNPLLLNLTVRDPINVMYDASQGKYGQAMVGAALIGLMPFDGGPLGVATRLGGKAIDAVKLRAFGKSGFIDEIGKLIKDDPVEYLQKLKNTDPAKYKESLQAWKAFEALNSSKFDGDTKAVVENIAEWHARHSNPLNNYTAEELTNYWIDFKKSIDTVQDLAKRGKLEIDGTAIDPKDAARVGLGKFGTEEKYALINELNKLPNKEARIAVVQAMVEEGYGWAQSPTMRSFIESAVQDDDYAKAILAIKTGKKVKINGADAEFPRNYFPIFLSKTAKGYDSEVLSNIDNITSSTEIADVLDRSIAPKGIAASVGGFFERLGLSPKDKNAQAFLAVRRNMGHNLADAGVEIDAAKRGGMSNSDYILGKLGDYADNKRSVFDLRQLKISEISEALGVSTKDAQAIRKSIMQAYLQVPLQVRGLGSKVVDFNMRYNPFAAQYSRAQGAFRYTYNPFFATQEVIETETLAQAVSGGKRLQLPGVNALTNIFRRDRDYLDSVISKLEAKGIFSQAAGRGEFATESITGGISAHLRNPQKVTIAGFVDKLAHKNGQNVDEYLRDHGDEAAELSRLLVQYPKKSGLNSPLATTLGLVAFPARYNLKVAQIAGRVLSQQTPLNQVLILNSIADMGDWLNSDEGIAWQSRNAEALGLFKYFTPLNTLGQLSKMLTGNAESAADYGSLGGLPFGVIGTIMDHQGLLNLNTPYINTRTGDVLPEYVPQTDKAKLKTALDDLIGSVFSYPGRMIGGPSKSEVIDAFTSKAPGLGVSRYDTTNFTKVDRQGELTAADMHRQQVIRDANGITQTPPGNTPNPFEAFAIPPPTQLKPLVKRPEKRSITAATRGNQSTAATGPKPKKIYTARPIQ